MEFCDEGFGLGDQRFSLVDAGLKLGLVKRAFLINNVLVQIHLIIENILVDQPYAMMFEFTFQVALYLPTCAQMFKVEG